MPPEPLTADEAEAVALPPRNATPGVVRVACAVVGTMSLALGLVGLALPVLPTTPFLLLAAACYARSSKRLYAWLVGQPALGPIITEWQRSRSLPPGVKARALVVVGVTFAISIALVDQLLVRAALAMTATILLVFLARIPTVAR